MGYECPVCETPQADARHLANHLAFTAVLGREDHEAWLDEHAPGWSEAGEAELAPRVAEHAESAEFDQVFEDTTGGLERGRPDVAPRGAGEHEEGHGHGHGHEHTHEEGDRAPTDPETRAVLEEARALTREMLTEGTDDDTDENDGDADGDNNA
jgi:hypothetical protein